MFDTINPMALTEIYRISSTNTKENTSYSAAHGSFRWSVGDSKAGKGRQ